MNRMCFYLLVILFSLSCTNNIYKNNRLEGLSNQAFFQYIYKGGEKNLPIYVDPIMKYRSSFLPDKMYGFRSALSSSSLLDSMPDFFCRIKIPDSLSNVFQFYNQSRNIACDSSIYYFVSPLLRTKTKNTFLMQVFLFSLVSEDDIIDRIRYQYWAEFKVEGGLVKSYKFIDSGDMGLFTMKFMQRECECDPHSE